MARYKRNYSRRRKEERNYVWMRWNGDEILNSIPVNGGQASNVAYLEPGLGVGGGTGDNIDHFEFETIVTRVRGEIGHFAKYHSTGSDQNWVPFNLGLIVVPVEFNLESSPDIRDNRKGDDYFMYHSALCNPSPSAGVNNTHIIDNKAKRRVDVGSQIALVYHAVNPTDAVVDVVLGWNFSILFELRK